MENSYYEQIKAAIQATIIHSPTSYSWFGKTSQRLPAKVQQSFTPRTARNYLLFCLQSQLYSNFYCQGLALPTKEEQVNVPTAQITSFVQELSQANSGKGYWSRGWKVREDKNEVIIACKDGLTLGAELNDCLVAEDAPIARGTYVSLRFPKEFLGLSPGFYMALGDEELSQDNSQTIVRLYWNLSAKGAIHFVQSVTLTLNEAHLPFKLKALNALDRFTRCDAVVLYVYRTNYDVVSKLLRAIYPEVAPHLKPNTPAFTKVLAPGVGLAESPAQGESFGLHRCQLFADGLIRAYEQGKLSVDERLDIVIDRFTEDRIRVEKPFLNPESDDDYDWQFQLPQQTQWSHASKPRLDTVPDRSVFLQTAYEIGQHLSQEAIWHGDRCNWLGAEPEVDYLTNTRMGTIYKTLGSELYGGTSGVALFLAELYAATEDSAIRRTALGAIQQALSRVDAVPTHSQLGLYSGWIGIAFTTTRIGTLLDDEKLIKQATQLLQRSAQVTLEKHEFDLIAGNAGAITALVILQAILDDRSLLEFATRLGDELLESAEISKAGYSWKSTAISRQRRNLTGFSHGTAGVGYALLELFQATGDLKYRRAAEQAFNYERHWFNADIGNWPDFRKDSTQVGQRTDQHSFANAWCHGAPGIALSRLRAYQLLKDESYKTESLIALQTTARVTEAALQSKSSNYSLCHGLAGNAEILLHSEAVLGQIAVNQSQLALAIANAGIELYATHEHLWPCGAGGGTTPSLMLGLAGIGYFYLRLGIPSIPSILILQLESFSRSSAHKAKA